MNFGSKLLLIALTTMHLHTEVDKSLFLTLLATKDVNIGRQENEV